MKYLLLIFILCFQQASALNIPLLEANQIADKIWKNECNKSIDGLTTWNKGENFASLGIAHFIWYVKGKEELFEETFPELLENIDKTGFPIPEWLQEAKGCPWKSSEDFYNNFHSLEMNQLRQLLLETQPIQTIFIAERLEKKFPEMVALLPHDDQKKVTSSFQRLANTSKGLFALIDYLNFKGAGTSPQESYQGHGWGLLQVLQQTNPESSDILRNFIETAKRVLRQRVRNSPPERHEERWLQGWQNRIDSYL